MEKIDAYKLLTDIRKTIYEAEIYVNKNIDMPSEIIADLNKLEDLAKNLEAYVLMTKDKGLISEVEKIPRLPLHNMLNRYDLGVKTAQSILKGWRCLIRIAPQNISGTAVHAEIQEKEQPANCNDKEGVENIKQNQFPFRVASIERIYDFCINTKVLDSEIISNIDFVNAVHSANFKAIHNHASKIKSKSKCKYIIYVLGKFMGADWYLKTAHSIDTEPNKCSGITVPMQWKTKADAIK